MTRKDALLRLHKSLVAKRDALRRQMLTDLDTAREGDASGDLCDAAQDGSCTELNSQLAALESRDLSQIERAIVRIRDGRYGTCEGCDARIPVERLRALPFSTCCIACQTKRERYGDVDDASANWESAYEYEGAHTDRELTIGDIDIDLS